MKAKAKKSETRSRLTVEPQNSPNLAILDKKGSPVLPELPDEFISLKNDSGFEIFYVGMDGEVKLKGKVIANDKELAEWCEIYYRQTMK